MKISYNWLKKYVDVKLEATQVAEILTDCGLEVEGLEKIQTVKGGLEGLVIGEILTKEKHPDADRLNLTTVNVGNGEPLHIVCGAPNVEVGHKVVVATIGTTLYAGDDSFKIKKSKIRGQLSEGMICAEDEIGLGSSHDGIMVLEKDAQIGTLVKEYFNIEDDYVFEIGLTPNRADATGHIGVARDLVAVLSLSGKQLKLNLPGVDDFKVDNTDLKISVEVNDHDLCPRYSGLTIQNITIKESPDWLKNSLLSIGLTPINNVVDVTNYVLHETGQPLHAFDAAKVKGNKVIVKTAKQAEKFKTLDEVERELSDKDLMIRNTEDSMCIAGVFGGIDSGVSETTTAIFIESAYFNPVSIRKSAKRHGLNTDASFRFERGADPNNTLFALKRAANLIKEVAGGEVSSDIIDVYPNPIENFEISFSYQNCNRLIGKEIEKETIKDILQSLEIEIIEESENGLKLAVPPFKVDVQREADVIEEVLRVYGYNNIDIPDMLQSSLSYSTKPEKEKVINLVSDWLVSNGFNEMLSNSLTKSDYYKDTTDQLVKIKNPLSHELEVLRQSMLFNGLETIAYNQNRKNSDLKLFEWGNTYLKKAEKYKQASHLSIFVSGKEHKENWNTAQNDVDYFFLKGAVNAIIEKLGLSQQKAIIEETNSSYYNYGLSYKINNQELVSFGKVNAETQKSFDIEHEVFYADFNIDNLMKLVNTSIQYKEVSKFPSVRRDLALLIDNQITYSQIEQLAVKQDRKLLKEVNLFDVYEGKNLPEGKKSYGVSFKFLDENKTLTDNQIDKVMSKIIAVFEKELKAQLR